MMLCSDHQKEMARKFIRRECDTCRYDKDHYQGCEHCYGKWNGEWSYMQWEPSTHVCLLFKEE
jgi:hypothetical protein